MSKVEYYTVQTSSDGYTLLRDDAAVRDVVTNKDSVRCASQYGDTTNYYVCYGPDLEQAKLATPFAAIQECH